MSFSIRFSFSSCNPWKILFPQYSRIHAESLSHNPWNLYHYNAIYGCNARSIIDKSFVGSFPVLPIATRIPRGTGGELASPRVPTFHMAADWILSSHLARREEKNRAAWRFIDFLYRREKFHFSRCRRNTNFHLLKIKFTPWLFENDEACI